MKSPLITIPIVLTLSGLVSGYSLVDTVIGSTFYSFFDWEAISDPTNGRVYVNQTRISFFPLILVETMSTKQRREALV